MTSRTNTTRHFLLVDTTTGQTVATEKCRDTLGGWANMMDRLAARLGGQLRSTDDLGSAWTVNGRTLRFEEWNTL